MTQVLLARDYTGGYTRSHTGYMEKLQYKVRNAIISAMFQITNLFKFMTFPSE